MINPAVLTSYTVCDRQVTIVMRDVARAAHSFYVEHALIVDPRNAEGLGVSIGGSAAEAPRGVLRYHSETGGWKLGGLDLDEHLATFREQRLVLVLAQIREMRSAAVITGGNATRGICGFVRKEVGERPRRKHDIAKRGERDRRRW